MFFERSPRRVLITAASLSAVLLAAACGGGSEPNVSQSSAGVDPLAEHGPISFVTGKDGSGNLQHQLDVWNEAHPKEKVTLVELPDSPDQQRSQLIANAEAKGHDYTVLDIDVVWTAVFAANKWIDELPEGTFDLSGFLPATVDSATYDNAQYAVPVTAESGLLYYRKDLLTRAGLEPPKTWTEMKAACNKVQKRAREIGCYAGQHQKFEGLMVNFAEAVNSSGGSVVDGNGMPTVNTPAAESGLTFLADGFQDGTIPDEALDWSEEEGLQAFLDGNLIFHRNWPSSYALANQGDGSSSVAGKFAVAPLPGLTGPGVSSLGGHNYAISSTVKNKGTAVEFITFMSSEDAMASRLKATSRAPTRTSLYADPELKKAYPYLPTLLASIEGAKSPPKVVKYDDVLLAIEEAAYAAEQDQQEPEDALAGLQTKLESLTR